MIGRCPTAVELLPTWTEADRQAFHDMRVRIHGNPMRAHHDWQRKIKRERSISAKTRKEILAWECIYCGGVSQVVDHFIPVSRGGLGVRANLVPACDLCNADKSDLFMDEWQARREKLGRPWPPPNTHEIYQGLVLSVLHQLQETHIEERARPKVAQELKEIVWTFQKRIYNGDDAWGEAKAALIAHLESLSEQADVHVKDRIQH